VCLCVFVYNIYVVSGLVDHLTHLFIEVTAICMNSQDNSDLKSATSILSTLLDTLHCTLKYVSDVVRKALQVSVIFSPN